MTEEEAKTKWCFAAVASHTDPRARVTYDRHGQEQPETFNFNCLGSECMAWRWAEWALNAGHFPPKADSPGYCGAAGPIR